MKIIALILIGLVAIEHLYILWIEMFAWTTAGRKTFRAFPAELFEPTKAMAANQGLYNGFLAIGLIWSIFIQNSEFGFYIACYFLTCVSIAGIYGGLTIGKSVFIKQGISAILALFFTILAFYIK